MKQVVPVGLLGAGSWRVCVGGRRGLGGGHPETYILLMSLHPLSPPCPTASTRTLAVTLPTSPPSVRQLLDQVHTTAPPAPTPPLALYPAPRTTMPPLLTACQSRWALHSLVAILSAVAIASSSAPVSGECVPAEHPCPLGVQR